MALQLSIIISFVIATVACPIMNPWQKIRKIYKMPAYLKAWLLRFLFPPLSSSNSSELGQIHKFNNTTCNLTQGSVHHETNSLFTTEIHVGIMMAWQITCKLIQVWKKLAVKVLSSLHASSPLPCLGLEMVDAVRWEGQVQGIIRTTSHCDWEGWLEPNNR